MLEPNQAGRLAQTDGPVHGPHSLHPPPPVPSPPARNEGAFGQVWAGQACFTQIHCGRLRNEVASLTINKAFPTVLVVCWVLETQSSRVFFLNVWLGLVCLFPLLHSPLPRDPVHRHVLLGFYVICYPGIML